MPAPACCSILVALGAVIAANSPLAPAYHALFHAELPWTPVAKLDTLHLWINDGAMAVFFFVVGLEIKREILQANCPIRCAAACRYWPRSPAWPHLRWSIFDRRDRAAAPALGGRFRRQPTSPSPWA